MKDSTKSKFIIYATIGIMILLGIFMVFSICKGDGVGGGMVFSICKGDGVGGGREGGGGEEIETLINGYSFWAVSTFGDSSFQTVQILKCQEMLPNGEKELLGYKVAVDSSGYRTYEEKPVWFLTWAVVRALSLREELK